MPLAAHVAVASLNQTVGDWAGNRDRILAAIDEARARGARLLVLPEMCIPGYSLDDRLLMQGTLERSWRVLEALLPHCHGIIVIVGLPVRHRDVLYNVAAVVANGRIWGLVPKENLATGDVQYENRWYSGWTRGHIESFTTHTGALVPIGALLFRARGLGKFGIEICEDGWKGIRPGSVYALAGAGLICNPSASWFVLGKHRVRRDMCRQISREDKVVYLYTSLLGCDATRLVFDGSTFIAQEGAILREGRRFLFDTNVEVTDQVLDLAALERNRLEEGSWRQQVEALQRGEFGKVPDLIDVEGDFTTDDAPPATLPYWLTDTTPAGPPDPSLVWLEEAGLVPSIRATDLPHLELELGLCMGLREYRHKCRIPSFTLALSGGRDSAMVALLVARALRYDNPTLSPAAMREVVHNTFTTAYLATDNSGSATRQAAKNLADELGARHYDGDIQAAFDTHLAIVGGMTNTALSWKVPAHDLPLQNVQARLRGSLIWMIANLNNSLLLCTSNKSEAAVGYTTMDGDTSGGLSPIADVPKSLVSLWLAWAAEYHGLSSIRAVVAQASTAELRPPDRAQTDEDDLMPFAVLDQLMYLFVQRGLEPLAMFRVLWPTMKDRYGGDPAAFAAHVERFVTLFCRAQWKRERFAISFRVTAFDLDPKTGFRFPPVQAPFAEELAELRDYVARLAQ